MALRSVWGSVGLALISAVVACSQTTSDDDVGGDRASVKAAAFNKNAVLTDTALRDSTAMTTEDIQSFLEKNPWGKASVLATYTEDGKSAAEIMHDAADKYGINPLELLVRAQMEQGLIYKQSASDESISIAFGCGCPHSPVCSSKYEGFANQAECAAGTLSRSMDRALTANGTVSGWKRGEEKLTQDKIEIIPENAATAALYTYTPYVGEAGGGQKGVGGASLHYDVWTSFAGALGYGLSPDDTKTPQQQLDAGPAPSADAGTGTPDDPPADDAGPLPVPKADASAPTKDAGAPPSESADAGESSHVPTSSGDSSDDDDILGEGNAPPTTDTPTPRSSGSRSRRGSDDGDPTEATEEELSRGKKTSTGGCSTTGGHGNASDAGLVGLAIAAASIIASRRRRQA